MNVSQQVIDAFSKSLKLHIQYVQEAGLMLGVPDDQLAIHDVSKWSDEEFYAYAQHFHGGGCSREFAKAWLHHIHLNPHHSEHWVLPQSNGLPSGFCENTSDILTKVYKFIKTHIALSSVDTNSNPLEIINFVTSSFGLGDNMINTGVKAWNQLFSRDSTPILLFFQLIEKNSAEFFVVMTAGIPDDSSPVNKAVVTAGGEGWFATTNTQTSKPMFLTEDFVPISVLSLPDTSFFFRELDISSSFLPGSLMQSSELNQLSASHFSFISDRESHLISLALDALLGSSKFFGENRGAVCFIPTKHDFLFFGRPTFSNSFIHDRLKYPVLNELFFNAGYYSTQYQWKQFSFPLNTFPNTATEDGVMEMPECFALEMVADWMGASYAYTQSWDMTEWLVKNMPKIRLHSKTADYVYSILDSQGYFNLGRFQ